MTNDEYEGRGFFLAGTGFSRRRVLEVLSPSSQSIKYPQIRELYRAAEEAHGWHIPQTQAWIREQKQKKIIDLTVGEGDELIAWLRAPQE